MKKFTFLALLLPIFCFSQKIDNNYLLRKKIDSLNEILIKTKNDSVKILINEKLSETYFVFRKDSGIIYRKHALELAKNKKKIESIKQNLRQLLIYQYIIGDYVNSIKNGLELKEESIRDKDTLFTIKAYANICYVYGISSDISNSIKYNLEKIELIKIWKNPLNDSLRKLSLADSYISLSNSFNYLKKYDSSLFFANNAYQILSNFRNPVQNTSALNIMGNYNFGIKNFDIALSYFIKSYNIVKSSGSKLFPIDWYANTVEKIGECYENLNKLDSSLKYYRLSFNLYNRIDFQEGLRTSSYRLFKLFDKLNKFDSAYHYQKRYLIVNDSILNNEKLTLLNNISMTENIKQIEKNEEIKKLAIEKDRNIKLGLIAIFIPTFFCIVYILSRKKKRNTKIVSILGLASLLMLFEFISMLIHPVIEHLTNHDTLIMYICLLIIATILIPLHHKLEQFVKSKL